jgi:hypothetical protein
VSVSVHVHVHVSPSVTGAPPAWETDERGGPGGANGGTSAGATVPVPDDASAVAVELATSPAGGGRP